MKDWQKELRKVVPHQKRVQVSAAEQFAKMQRFQVAFVEWLEDIENHHPELDQYTYKKVR